MPDTRSPPATPPPSSIASIRARLLALVDAHARGEIDAKAYQAARREAERELAEAVLATPTPEGPTGAAPAAPRPSTRLVIALTVVVLLIAAGGYAFTGSPSLAGLGAAPQAQAPAPVAGAGGGATGNDREIGMQQVAEMVDKLAARLKDRPDDAEGWTMLARSYTVLARYGESLPAYQRAIELQPKNAALLADYSDARAAANGGKPDAESLASIDRALAIDPNQPKALALAGTVAFDRGDFATAARQWQKIADALPPGSEFHQQVIANIDEARRRGEAASPVAPAVVATAPATIPARAAPAAAGREALSGTVTLAPALAARVSPGDTVFVLARAETGRMPLAVFRATAGELPLRFRLDDSMAMTPTMKISDMKQVIVAARVSKSGNAITQPGDLSGEIGPVAPGANDLAIEIANVVPAR